MKIIKFEKNTREDEIFNRLKGKMFFAVSAVKNEDESYTYEWHTKEIPAEVIMMGIELLKNEILNECE